MTHEYVENFPPKNTATAHLIALIEDYHSFNPSLPPLLPYPTALAFCKQVSKGLPCIYKIPEDRQFCPAQSWSGSSLTHSVKDPVEVALTPNGRADSLLQVSCEKQPVFVQPASMQMTFSELLNKLAQPQSTPVYYLQSQNGNLNSNTPLTPLLADLPASLPFASDVLGDPEAINIWLGTSLSVTSTHRDPYENLYLVLKGSKTFTLYAPVDEMALCAQHVATGRYVYDDKKNEFDIMMDESADKIPWIPIDPLLPYDELISKYPLYKYAQPQRVKVEEGQILYLPAGWFHHVEQECGVWADGTLAPCCAVNYWYDQDYEGEKYVMRQHVGKLTEVARDQASGNGLTTKINRYNST